MELNTKTEDKIAILTITGNLLGENDTKPILDFIESSIKDGIAFFIFELSEMKYINSTGLSILLNTLAKSRKSNGEMCLVNIPTQLSQLLEITKLDKTIPQCESVEKAKSKINK